MCRFYIEEALAALRRCDRSFDTFRANAGKERGVNYIYIYIYVERERYYIYIYIYIWAKSIYHQQIGGAN